MNDHATPADSADKETIGPILGKIPSGVFIFTAASADGRETGMLASWVQQASFDPPQITVCVNKTRYLNEWLRENPVAGVSVVAESDKTLLKHFGKGFEPDDPAFEGIATSRGETGVRLLDDATGALEGRISGTLESGDHMIYLLEIIGAGSGNRPDDKPMVHLRRNGFSY